MDPTKVFDRVHGAIVLPELAARITCTAVFQRLDGVRQLGGCAYVYPSATHTRREHSIGVCHLAGRLARRLQRLHPDMVSDDDVLCVEISGLVHDLGHGPFSHLFEEYAQERDPSWSHERMGLALLRILVRELGSPVWLLEHLPQIEACVVGGGGGVWHGREFMADVVHNARSRVPDVDRLDYLARDSLAVFGATRPLDLDRLIGTIYVDPATGTLACRDRDSIGDVMYLRAKMHRCVYQHHSVAVVEHLLKEVLRRLETECGVCVTVWPAEHFQTLTDSTVLNLARALLPGAWSALHQRPWMHRLPLTVEMRSLCEQCGQCTTEEEVPQHDPRGVVAGGLVLITEGTARCYVSHADAGRADSVAAQFAAWGLKWGGRVEYQNVGGGPEDAHHLCGEPRVQPDDGADAP